jgi:hypothetical protein
VASEARQPAPLLSGSGESQPLLPGAWTSRPCRWSSTTTPPACPRFTSTAWAARRGQVSGREGTAHSMHTLPSTIKDGVGSSGSGECLPGTRGALGSSPAPRKLNSRAFLFTGQCVAVPWGKGSHCHSPATPGVSAQPLYRQGSGKEGRSPSKPCCFQRLCQVLHLFLTLAQVPGTQPPSPFLPGIPCSWSSGICAPGQS